MLKVDQARREAVRHSGRNGIIRTEARAIET